MLIRLLVVASVMVCLGSMCVLALADGKPGPMGLPEAPNGAPQPAGPAETGVPQTGGPMELVAYRASLVVVGEVTEVGKTTQEEFYLPEAGAKTKAGFQKYVLKVTQTIKSPKDAKPVKTVDVFARTNDATPGGGMMGSGGGTPVPFVTMEKGKSYVLFLTGIKGRTEYYLPMFQDSALKATEKTIARAKLAADVSKWPWGKEDAGLQIAVIPAADKFEQTMVGEVMRPGMPPPAAPGVMHKNVGVQMVVALRNAGKTDLRIPLFSPDKFMTVTLKTSDGKIVEPLLYEFLKMMSMAPFNEDNVHTLKPGQVMLICQMGERELAQFGVDIPLGRTTMKVTFTSKKSEVEVKDAKPVKGLWKGSVTSKEATFEAVKAEVHPM